MTLMEINLTICLHVSKLLQETKRLMKYPGIFLAFIWAIVGVGTFILICLNSLLMMQNITDDDLIALVSDEVFQPQEVWKLGDVQACLHSKCFQHNI